MLDHENTDWCVMGNGLKNVTISLDEAVLRETRIAAARRGKSLSRFIAETLARNVAAEGRSHSARFLGDRLSSSAGGPLPDRDARHAR